MVSNDIPGRSSLSPPHLIRCVVFGSLEISKAARRRVQAKLHFYCVAFWYSDPTDLSIIMYRNRLFLGCLHEPIHCHSPSWLQLLCWIILSCEWLGVVTIITVQWVARSINSYRSWRTLSWGVGRLRCLVLLPLIPRRWDGGWVWED